MPSSNIAGFSLGLACSFFILLWVVDEVSYDHFHEHRDDLYRAIRHATFSGQTDTLRYADSRQEEVPMAGPLSITTQGRTVESNCLVGPAKGEVLIGQIELERLDFLINCAEPTLAPIPRLPTFRYRRYRIRDDRV